MTINQMILRYYFSDAYYASMYESRITTARLSHSHEPSGFTSGFKIQSLCNWAHDIKKIINSCYRMAKIEQELSKTENIG